MSIRRAVEAHIKWSLDPYFVGQPHQVFESLRIADKPVPAIVVVAAAAQSALENQPDPRGNYNVPVTVIVMSSIDGPETSPTKVDVHANVAHLVGRILNSPGPRGDSQKVEGLYVYNLLPGSVGEENDGRKMISVLNYEAVVCYGYTDLTIPPLP